MSPKITVLTTIYRPGYIDSTVQALKGQTFKEFEWVLVDDLFEQRKGMLKAYIGNAFPLKHMPPREINPFAQTCMAANTGLIHAEGELVYFMVDYMYLHPRVLERHWEIYSKYGPKVLISGPLIDAIVASGKSVWSGAPPVLQKIKDDEGNIVTFSDPTPPIPLPLKDNFEQPTLENLISIFKEPFKPTWPEIFPPDWRLGAISKVPIAQNLYENDDNGWFWVGRNDSAPLEALLEINGMNEAFDGRRGGADGNLADRLMTYGCKYLVDREVPCYMLPHPTRKRAAISEEERMRRVEEKRINKIPDDYNLRAERAKLGLATKTEIPDVSIVICHIGSVELLNKCVESIKRTTKIPHEIVIVADKPDDEVVKHLATLSEQGIKVITNPEQIGATAALNMGYQAAKGEYLAYMTIDIELCLGAIQAMRKALSDHPNFGWVALSTEYTGFYAGCSMITREAFKKVGLWDASYEYAFADDDYMRRMWKAGYNPHIVDGVKVSHKHPEIVTKVKYSQEERKERFARCQALFHQNYGEWGTNWDALPKYQAYKGEDQITIVNIHRIDWIRGKVTPEDTILEVACAENPVWGGTEFKVTTLDKSTRPQENCFPDVVGEAENLPFEPKSFDVVAVGELLEHIADPQRVLKEAIRMARKKVIVTVPWEHEWPQKLKPFWNPGHVRFYTPETFNDELAKVGLPFKLEKIRHNGWAWLGAEIYCNGGSVMSEQVKKLNIGSFTVMLAPPWLNLDIIDLSAYAKEKGFNFQQVDVTKGLPFEDNSIDFINSSHLIEHLTIEEGIAFLRECRRVLKPNAVARVGSPDVSKLVDAYKAGEMDKFSDIQPEEYNLAPSQADKFWRILTAGHKTCYDLPAIKHSLEAAGFKEVDESEYNQELDMFPEVSVYVEAKKGLAPPSEIEQFMKEKAEGKISTSQPPEGIPEYWRKFATEDRMKGN